MYSVVRLSRLQNTLLTIMICTTYNIALVEIKINNLYYLPLRSRSLYPVSTNYEYWCSDNN